MPAGESEARAKTKAIFDEVFKRYTDAPSEERKSKKKNVQSEESIALESLKKKLDLNKDTEDDSTILKNTYQPDQSSPRYIKNKLRAKELSEKVNYDGAAQEDGMSSRDRKRGRRNLPKPPPKDDVSQLITRADEDDGTGSARVVGLKAVPGADRAERMKVGGEKGKKKGKREGGAQEREVEADDELLQEYQQQIVREERRAVKKTSSKRAPEGRSSSSPAREAILNNDVEKKKKKKLRSQETAVDAGSELGSQPDDSARKHGAEQGTTLSDTETAGPGEQAGNQEEQLRKKNKRSKVVKEESGVEEEGPNRQAFDDSLVLGVYIHRSDQLKTDLLVSKPVVKVYVVDEVTGQYVKKEDSHLPASSSDEQEKVGHILPVTTQPFDFKKNKSTIPEWEEQIIFNERFGYFLQNDNESPRVMLFFEVLDSISVDEAKANMQANKHEPSFRKIAWAFLKLVGTNGLLNVDSKVRLQLYCPPPRVKKQPHAVEVVEWWRKYPRSRYASTLYVTVKGLKRPEHSQVDPLSRSMMALPPGRSSTSLSGLNDDVAEKSGSQELRDQADIVQWSRVPGQVCRVPNKLMLSLRGGQMGCLTLRFSHAGRRLAAACTDRDAFPIMVYEIPSGKVLAAFNGHLSIVYDVCWSRDDQSLLSASSDGTVRIWNVERLCGAAKKVLPHPSFVYSAQYHPAGQHLVVTGGFDCLIRVWNINVQDVNGQLLHEFEGHKAFINALCFDPEGLWMFSADSAGLIVVWNVPVGEGSHRHPTQLWNIEREIMESNLKGISISALEVHPNGRRLLIHTKDSVLRVMDLRILAVKKYTGATNYRERIRSTFSPCGTFIFSGSEDGMAYVWNAETGDQVAVYSELGYPTPLRDVAFHPHENMVAFCAFGEAQAMQVYIYDRKVAQMEVERLKGLTRSGPADPDALSNMADLPALLQPGTSTWDQLAGATRVSLKMQRVKQKLDSVLVSSDLSLPALSLLSPHSKLQAPGARLPPPASLTISTRGFSPVGQRLSQPPSLRLQTTYDGNPSSSLQIEADSFLPVQQTVVSLYDYGANRSDELTVSRGDIIYVLYKDNENWWFGRLSDGRQGYFPANYVVDQRDFEEEPHKDVDTDTVISDRLNQSTKRSTPARISAAVSMSGELRFISEHDTDPETATLVQKKKKRMKKSGFVTGRLASPSADIPGPSWGKEEGPLPKRGQPNSDFQTHK